MYLTLSLFLTVAGRASAQDFNPIENTTITSEQVAVDWYSSASQQWLRAFDSNTGVKIYDSGRLSERFGQLTLSLPTGISNLKLIFFEKSSGGWAQRERLYPVILNSGSGEEICPQEYLDQLRSVEFYQQPLPDGSGGTSTITKEVETLSYYRFNSNICTIEWGYGLDNPASDKVRHIFRQAVYPEGGIGGGFSAFVFSRGAYREIEIEYIGGSDGDGGTPYKSGKSYIPVTYDQWKTCGLIAGCDFDDF